MNPAIFARPAEYALVIGINCLLGAEAVVVALVQLCSMSFGWVLGILVAIVWVAAWGIAEARMKWAKHSTYWVQMSGAAALLLCGMFVYFPLMGYQYRVIDYGNGNLVYTDANWTAYVVAPFVHPTYAYAEDQTIGLRHALICQGKTADGAPIGGKMSAMLTLPFAELGLAHVAGGSQEGLTKKIGGELCSRFADVAASYKIADLPSGLAYAYQAGSKQQQGMNNMGVLYAGYMSVWGFTAVVDQRRN